MAEERSEVEPLLGPDHLNNVADLTLPHDSTIPEGQQKFQTKAYGNVKQVFKEVI